MRWSSQRQWIAVLCWLDAVSSLVFLRAPQDLDGIHDNSSVIVAGSVIQLFCSASGQFTAPHIQWTWNNITIPETSKLPHLMVKSLTQNNTITSSVLTIYGFSTSDNGSYQCNASDNGSSNVSQPLLLTAINGSNVLTIIRELNINIGPDRTSVPLGSSNISSNGSFLRCSAQQPGLSSLTAPSMIWLKDGTQLSGDGVRVVITTTNSTVGTSNRTTSFVRIFNFSQSDAGVYQCVFYDTPSQGGEVITTRPYKVDTGPASLIAMSPSSICLRPPEPLVIQVKAGGEYAGIQWTRTPIALNVSSDELVDFQQTFVRTVTSEEDWGLYTVNLVNSSNSTLASINVSVNTTSSSTANQSTRTPSPAQTSIGSPGIPAAVPMVIVIATIVGVVGGVIVLVILTTAVCTAVGVAHRRKSYANHSTKPVGAVYEDLDGTEAVRMYETIPEANHKQPVFEYFEDIPTIVPKPKYQERFEGLYNEGDILTADLAAPDVCLPRGCQPYSEPTQSVCSRDGFHCEGDAPSRSSTLNLPTNQSGSSLLLGSRSTSPPPVPLRADGELQPTFLVGTDRAKSCSPLEQELPAVSLMEQRAPMPVPRGTPVISHKSGSAATLSIKTTPTLAPPPDYPYSYVSRGDLFVAVKTSSGTFSARNSPASSRHSSPASSRLCSHENSVCRSSPAPESGNCERIMAEQSPDISLSSQTLD